MFLEDGDRLHVCEGFEDDSSEEGGERAADYDYTERIARDGAAIGSGHCWERDVVVVEADGMQLPYEAENGTWAVQVVDDMVHKQM